MVSQGVRYFTVGETVFVRAKVAKPGTKTPIDPDSVLLAALTRDSDGEGIVVPAVFSRIEEGDYFLAIATDDLDPDAYSLVVRVLGPEEYSPRKVVLAKDRFVLKAA